MQAQRVAVIGSGYVGTVVAAGLGFVGHDVVGVECDSQKLSLLRQGQVPFYETDLERLLTVAVRRRRLRFTDDFRLALDHADVVFVCVGTPAGPDGTADMTATFSVASEIGRNLRRHHIIVTKSTVPVGTGRWVRTVVEEAAACHLPAPGTASMVSNPEFLREGSAVRDFLSPDRVVLGSDDPEALEVMTELYRPIIEQRFPGAQPGQEVTLLRTGLTSAEMIKYASNAFLATKISFANEVARLCDHVGADVMEVTRGMGLDARIGSRFLEAGLGWGGSCFGKDLAALVGTASDYRYEPRILHAAISANEDQRQHVVDGLLRRLRTLRGTRIAIMGLAFKPGTDDLRDAPALDIADRLMRQGAFVSAYDPMVRAVPGLEGLRLADDPYEAARGADAVLVATEWPEITSLDLARLFEATRGDVFFDGRNCFDPIDAKTAGFDYIAIGRTASADCLVAGPAA